MGKKKKKTGQCWDEVAGEWYSATLDESAPVQQIDGLRLTWGTHGRDFFYVTADGPRLKEFMGNFDARLDKLVEENPDYYPKDGPSPKWVKIIMKEMTV